MKQTLIAAIHHLAQQHTSGGIMQAFRDVTPKKELRALPNELNARFCSRTAGALISLELHLSHFGSRSFQCAKRRFFFKMRLPIEMTSPAVVP
jgi:hypothetical protein